jgi:hypothetical protein
VDLFSRDAPLPDIRATLTRERLDRFTAPVLLAEIDAAGPSAAFGVVAASQTGPVVQWRSDDQSEITTRSGLLIATQGLGHDLHSADVAAISAAFGRGGGRALPRIHRYLDGGGGLRLQAFVCDLFRDGREGLTFYGRTYAATVWRERCHGPDVTFENVYWLGDDRILRRSRQWIGPTLGMIQLDRVVD